jgi:hypothetical protein
VIPPGVKIYSNPLAKSVEETVYSRYKTVEENAGFKESRTSDQEAAAPEDYHIRQTEKLAYLL